jgi:hypothetical protein
MDLFGVMWLAGVAVFVAAQGAWFIRALRTGVVTYYFRYDFSRDQDPFKFWMLTAGRGFAVLFGLAMFASGLRFWMV